MLSMRAVVLLVVSISLALHAAVAKRGCSAFGHSCYGGHGKRSSDTALNEDEPGMLSRLVPGVRRQAGQEEVPQNTMYPAGRVLQDGDDIIPIRDGGAYNNEDNEVMKDLMKYRLRNIVKHWMDTYRRNQPNSDEGQYQDSSL